MELARVAYDAVLEDAKLKPEDVNYVATTGEAEDSRSAPGISTR